MAPVDVPHMDEHAAFLRAIQADVVDEQPKLAYAAWLASHGRVERAEFIRRQCRPPAGDWAEHHRRLEALANGVAAYPEFVNLRDVVTATGSYESGFYSSILELSPEACVRDAQPLYCIAPTAPIYVPRLSAHLDDEPTLRALSWPYHLWLVKLEHDDLARLLRVARLDAVRVLTIDCEGWTSLVDPSGPFWTMLLREGSLPPRLRRVRVRELSAYGDTESTEIAVGGRSLLLEVIRADPYYC
jgi:uncharacterized protein (TIGR02996 family)